MMMKMITNREDRATITAIIGMSSELPSSLTEAERREIKFFANKAQSLWEKISPKRWVRVLVWHWYWIQYFQIPLPLHSSSYIQPAGLCVTCECLMRSEMPHFIVFFNILKIVCFEIQKHANSNWCDLFECRHLMGVSVSALKPERRTRTETASLCRSA